VLPVRLVGMYVPYAGVTNAEPSATYHGSMSAMPAAV
jgi:hypothetical protein